MIVSPDAIFKGEIYVKSQYLMHEHRLFEFLQSQLLFLGWKKEGSYPSSHRWTKHDREAIVCLADDFTVHGANLRNLPARWFRESAVIITDNHVNFVPDYRVLQLPRTYFGIYCYQPGGQHWEPVKDIGLCINRMDLQRCKILLEFVRQGSGLESVLANNLINFNAWVPGDNNTKNAQKHWRTLTRDLASELHDQKTRIEALLPLRNHAFTVEQVHTHAWLNCVVETYCGDYVNAFSEKIFRALSTPAPWMLYGSRGAVQYLDSMGFDVMHDIIDHSYDRLWYQGKIEKFWKHSRSVLGDLKRHGKDKVSRRCQQAAGHNRALLKTWQHQWPNDFARVLPKILHHLSA